MREITRDEPYAAADWICQRVLPASCRSLTPLPWPVLDDLPRMERAGRVGIRAAEQVHPRVNTLVSALSAGLGPDHRLTTVARLATVIVNECKFHRQSPAMCELALTRTVEIAESAVALGMATDDAKAVAAWKPLADGAPEFAEVVSP